MGPGAVSLSYPAEHLLKGVAAPMEMHLVFSDPSSSNLLVVGRWIDVSSANSALDPIFSHLPQTTSDTLNIDHFNLNTLLPANLESFRYPGSLTTPPFSENVSWIRFGTAARVYPKARLMHSAPFSRKEMPVTFKIFMDGLSRPTCLGSLLPFPNRKRMPCCLPGLAS